MAEGFIKIMFRHRPIKNGGCLDISVQDSGSGFDLHKVQSELGDNEQYAGRGIGLLKELCHSVRYLGNGNRVKAIYKWSM